VQDASGGGKPLCLTLQEHVIRVTIAGNTELLADGFHTGNREIGFRQTFARMVMQKAPAGIP
jgi:hypothetical protein